MAREISRVKQGFFASPDRVVEYIAAMLTPEQTGVVTVVDAGCGEGKAISDLRAHWLKRFPAMNCKLLGIESERNRAESAQALIKAGPGGGDCLWSAIEDCRLHNDDFMSGAAECSLLYFNPPFDRIRGQGRMEMEIFRHVVEWPMRAEGLLVFVLPDYVLEDPDAGIGTAIERNYQVLRRLKFPEPEYQDFKQCVVIARRRSKALNRDQVPHPSWAENKESWPVMDDKGSPKEIKIYGQHTPLTLRRVKLSVDIINSFVVNSPLRGQLLMDAISPAPKIGRPPLGLSSGHLALALAGGLCDGIIENGPDDQFLVKGSLKSVVRKTGTKVKTDKDGEVTADIDVYKTRYDMIVRCLRSDGSIEEFTSNDGGEELSAVGAVVGEDDAE